MKVCINPGHGGRHSGAVGPSGYTEKEAALDISKRIVQELKKYKADIILTREGDYSVSLSERIRIANNNNCDLLLDIHLNGFSDTSVGGFETFIRNSPIPGEKEMQRIFHDKLYTYLSTLDISDRGMKSNNFYVQRNANMPSILLEYIFITNPDEEALAKKKEVRQKLAKLTARATAEYLGLGRKTEDTTSPIYRVQAGAYSQRDNAVNQYFSLKEQGYDVYLGQRNNLYIVQVSAFSNQNTAKELKQELEEAGHEAYISTEALKPVQQPESPPNEKGEEEDNLPKGRTEIKGKPKATIAQAQEWARKRGAHERFIDAAIDFWDLGDRIGIRPEIAYIISAKETNFGNYGGVVPPEYNNWAGIKTAGGGGDNAKEAHEKFKTRGDGIRAVYNHLAAYTGLEPIGDPHERFNIVMTTDWAGTIKYLEHAAYYWATDEDYPRSIREDYYKDLLATKAPEQEEEQPDKNLVEEIIEAMKNLIELLKKFIKKEG